VDSPSELKTSSLSPNLLDHPAKTHRFGSFSFRGSNDTPPHNNRVDSIDADMQLDFGSRSKQSALAFCHREHIPNGKQDMKYSSAAAALLVGVMLSAQAAAGSDRGLPCVARVLHSEQLPFAPIDSWLVKVTLEITPPKGGAFITTLQDSTPWQVPPPRRGQTFRLRCDPAYPANLHLMSQAAGRTAF
jgi:hypothetical protein